MRTLRCAYLTMDDISDYVSDAPLSHAVLSARGWDIDMVSWRDAGAHWDDYDAVYICTPWDYTEHPDEFIATLRRIDASRALLVNDLSIVLWNWQKTYLRDLEHRGVTIVPSLWFDNFAACDWQGCFQQHKAKTIVAKPVVGANARATFVLQEPINKKQMAELETTFSNRAFIVQPFLSRVRDEGEYSLFFFGGDYSHAILKVPKPGDFRVQEEHGASITPMEPSGELIAMATEVMAKVQPAPVYGRADFVRSDDDQYQLMELELIEPSLYFRTSAESAERFAKAFDEHVRAALGAIEL